MADPKYSTHTVFERRAYWREAQRKSRASLSPEEKEFRRKKENEKNASAEVREGRRNAAKKRKVSLTLQEKTALAESAQIYAREYRVNNKEEINAANKIRRLENLDKARAADREYYNSHRDILKVATNKYRATDKAKAKINARQILRITAMEAACPKWCQIYEIEKIYERCSRISKETGIKHHVDHIIPLQSNTVCGLHVPWNLRVTTAVENCKKGNRYRQEDALAFVEIGAQPGPGSAARQPSAVTPRP